MSFFLRLNNISLSSFPGGSDGKESACSAGGLGLIPGGRNIPWRREWTHSSILAWRISWTGEPGRLESMGLQTVGHNSTTNASTFHYFIVCTDHILFIYQSVGGLLGWSHILTSVNNATMYMGMWWSLPDCFLLFWIYIAVEFLGHTVILYLMFWGTAIPFSIEVTPFYISTGLLIFKKVILCLNNYPILFF